MNFSDRLIIIKSATLAYTYPKQKLILFSSEISLRLYVKINNVKWSLSNFLLHVIIDFKIKLIKNKIKDIIRYAYYVTSANFYEINHSPNLALRNCISNQLPKFLKENIFIAEINIFDNL